MKLDRKGFMASAVLYVLLGLFISLMISVVLIYSNRKILMDKLTEKVSSNLEQNGNLDTKTGDREDYFKAARNYMETNKNYENFNKDEDVSLIDVNSLINEGLLPKDIVSPLTNRKEITQNNYVVAVVNGDDYTFSYVDNATAKDYISVMNKVNDRLTALENESTGGAGLLNKVYPVGSIYITTSQSTPAQVQSVLGGSWEVYGSGRSLVGINTADANFNAVNKTGGSTTTTLSVANIPAHTHSIPALSGTTGGAGSHNHGESVVHFRWLENANKNKFASTTGGNIANDQELGTKTYTDWVGDHAHSLSTYASTSGSTGSATAFSNLSPYITVYMYKRTA